MPKIHFVFKSILLAFVTLTPVGVSADEVVRLGYGRLINNDFLGDFKDRGQTGSYVSSRIYGRSWNGDLPMRAGELLEFRVQADIKAPDDLMVPAAGDRPFAGSISLGLHTHYQQFGYDISMGGELVAVGPQTMLDGFQTMLHDLLGVAPPSAATKGGQIGDKVYPGAIVEFSRPFDIGSRSRVQPFVEARGGVETLLRAGFDLEIGTLSRGDLMIRDGITGQKYSTMPRVGGGFSFVAGLDTAIVSESAYLPTSLGYTLTDHRDRARIGLNWQRDKSHGFFGVTYLGKEYKNQESGQLVGSVRIALNF